MKVVGINKECSSLTAKVGPRVLLLAAVPSDMWLSAFAEVYRKFEEPLKKNINIEATELTLSCHIEELQQQITAINMLCQQADELVKQWEIEIEEAKLREQEINRENRRIAEDIIDNLKF